MPSSRTNTSPCSIGFKVPASTFRYGSAFIAVTLKPRDFKRSAIEEVAIPLPIPEITPPETKTTLVFTIKNPPAPRLRRVIPPFLTFINEKGGLGLLSFSDGDARHYFRKI